jgi:hypothetical protein
VLLNPCSEDQRLREAVKMVGPCNWEAISQVGHPQTTYSMALNGFHCSRGCEASFHTETDRRSRTGPEPPPLSDLTVWCVLPHPRSTRLT